MNQLSDLETSVFNMVCVGIFLYMQYYPSGGSHMRGVEDKTSSKMNSVFP